MDTNRISSSEKNIFNKYAVHPLQSWEWGEFRKKWGNEIIRLGNYSEKNLQDSIQVVFSKIPRSKYKIGTVLRGSKPNKKTLQKLKEIAKEKNAVFIKLEPNALLNISPVIKNTDFDKTNVLKKVPNNLKASKKDLQILEKETIPGKTLFTPTSFWIDLSKDEDTLMKNMHPKTRYNVRYAEKKGVVIIEDNSDKAFEKYIKLTRETVERQGFYAHTENYHRLMWQTLHKEMVERKDKPIARLLTARFRKEILTTWIVFAWNDFLYYPYGASSNRRRNLQHSSAMMWGAILYGKKLGLKWFDLWGREEGQGFTRFKEGFNPYVVEFMKTWDLPTTKLYWPYRLAEEGRWLYLRTKAKTGLIKHRF